MASAGLPVTMRADFPGGSLWRKWDLHVHSPLSLLNNQFPRQPGGGPDWEAYISRLELLDVAVIGVTDYFTVDGYKKVKDFKDAGRIKKVHTVLPNIEFRLDNVLSSRKDGEKIRRLNFHVIFSDEVSVQDIEEHFLHDLNFYYEGGPQTRDETRKLKVSNIEALGKKLIAENKQLRDSGETPHLIGARTTVVGHEQITEILTRDSRFKDKYLLIFPEELSNLIEWGKQDHIIRQGLLQKSDMVFSSNSRTAAWCVGSDPYKEGRDAFIKEFKSLKPCIHGSDAHNLDYMGRPCAKRGIPGHDCVAHAGDCELRHCWIKADPTFEGLKQLKYEPVDRVRIQQSDPTPLKSNSCISGLRIDGTTVNDELSIALASLPFNAGLVAVTGGKGAGKTALVDLIANLFVDRCNSNDSNSFVRRIVRDNANLNVAITLGDGVLFEKSLGDSRFVEQSEIVYIAQGELEDYIGENSDLNKYVRDLIFESAEVKNTVKAFEFDKLSKRVREVEIELSQRNQAIEKLEGRTAEKVLTAAKREKTQIEAESRDVESKIPALELKLTKEKVEVVEQKQSARSKLQGRKRDLIELGELLANAKQFVSEDLSRFNLYASKINNLLEELKIEGTIPTLEYEAAKGLGDIADKVESELSQVVTAIEASEKELQGYESEMQEHARYLSRRNDLATKLAGINKKLETVASDAQELEKNRRERDGLFGELLRTILEQQHKYAEIIEVFGSQKAEVLSDLDFKPNVQFARGTLLDGLQEILDNRQVEVLGTEDVPSQFRTLQDLYGLVSSGDVTAIDRLVDETSRLCEDIKPKMKKAQAISVGNLYKCLYRTYLSVVPIVTYKKTSLNKLSMGQKATVLIKIYLAQGRNPIIIDSHDDHLDNEFIMDELVGAIRKAKTYRQIILASNNGNVVINSDAEQIVIAHRQQGQISYVSGSIENPAIRDRALKVLEGGADAFKKRQEKYRVEP
jgi:hypothetical protein